MPAMLPTMQPPASLHDNAVQALQHVHELAVGLAHAGANPQAVQQLTQMGKILSQIASALAAGPPIGQDAQGPPQQQPPGPSQAPPPGPPQPSAPSPQQSAQTHAAAFGQATHALHQAMMASGKQQH